MGKVIYQFEIEKKIEKCTECDFGWRTDEDFYCQIRTDDSGYPLICPSKGNPSWCPLKEVISENGDELLNAPKTEATKETPTKE